MQKCISFYYIERQNRNYRETCKHSNQKSVQYIELKIKHENGVTYHVLATVKEAIRPGVTIVIE